VLTIQSLSTIKRNALVILKPPRERYMGRRKDHGPNNRSEGKCMVIYIRPTSQDYFLIP